MPVDYSPGDLRALRALLADYDDDPLLRLFHDCFYAGEDEFSADHCALLRRVGLIASDPVLPGMIYGTVAILRIAGDLILCDRGDAPDGSTFPQQPDLVYPPVFDNTAHFLSSLPDTPCEAMLELGTGSGIAAMFGARRAQHVWATDITARAVHFAALNCRLAGLNNVTVLQGDLYQPVDGLTFDRIVFHPPWMPRSQAPFAFGDGGEDGEAIIRGSIEGLPRFLRPGGRFHATLLASHHEHETFDQRVHRWLGPESDRFNVTTQELSRDSPAGFLAQNLARGSIRENDIPLWTELWKATRTVSIFFGHLTVARAY